MALFSSFIFVINNCSVCFIKATQPKGVETAASPGLQIFLQPREKVLYHYRIICLSCLSLNELIKFILYYAPTEFIDKFEALAQSD